MILPDIDVVSEPLKPAPHARAVAWLRAQPSRTLYLSCITFAEMRGGVEMLPMGQRRELLFAGILSMEAPFGDRILPFDFESAARFGAIVARARAVGNPIAFADAAMAAIALRHGFTIATRDVNDFRGTSASLINQWD